MHDGAIERYRESRKRRRAADITVAREVQSLIVGLVAAPGPTEQLARRLIPRLSALLEKKIPRSSWTIVVHAEPLAGLGPLGGHVDLVQLTRRLALSRGWHLAVCLTDRPLSVGRRPVTADASVTLGVGILSMPALGAIAIEHRCLRGLLRTIGALIDGPERRPHSGSKQRSLARVRRHLDEILELSSPVGRAFAHEDGSVRFATATTHGNLRLLFGVIRTNRPWRMIIGMSRSLVAALGTAAFALTSPAIWRIADAMRMGRMQLLAFGSLFAMGFTLVAAHRLWEWSPNREARERVVLGNMAMACTVGMGVVTSFFALVAFVFAVSRVLIVPAVLEHEVHHGVHLGEYVRIAWVVSSLATFGGALGAIIESDATARAAAYCIRPTDRRGHDRISG